MSAETALSPPSATRRVEVAVFAISAGLVLAAGFVDAERSIGLATLTAIGAVVGVALSVTDGSPRTWFLAAAICVASCLVVVTSGDRPSIVIAGCGIAAVAVVLLFVRELKPTGGPMLALGPLAVAVELAAPDVTLASALAIGGFGAGLLDRVAPHPPEIQHSDSIAATPVLRDRQPAGPVAPSAPPFASAYCHDEQTFGDAVLAARSSAGRRSRKGSVPRSVDHAIAATHSGEWAVVVLADAAASPQKPHLCAYWASRVLSHGVAAALHTPGAEPQRVAHLLTHVIDNSPRQVERAVKLVDGSLGQAPRVNVSIHLVPVRWPSHVIIARNHDLTVAVWDGHRTLSPSALRIGGSASTTVETVDLRGAHGFVGMAPATDNRNDPLGAAERALKSLRDGRGPTTDEHDTAIFGVWTRATGAVT